MLLQLPTTLGGVGTADKEILKKTDIRTENELGNGMAKWLPMASFPSWHPDEISKYAENSGASGGCPFPFINVGAADSILILQLFCEKLGYPSPAWIPLQPLKSWIKVH